MKISDLVCKDIAIHCKNKTELKKLLKELTYRGYRWGGDNTPAGSYSPYVVYHGSTCIEIQDDGVWYESVEYFKHEGHMIIEFNELELEEI